VQCLAPLIRNARFVEGALLFLRRFADAFFHRRILDRHEGPRLLVRAAGGGAGNEKGVLDGYSRHGVGRKLAHRTPLVGHLVLLGQACRHLLGGHSRGLVRDEAIHDGLTLP
jgi:hypothetical protein